MKLHSFSTFPILLLSVLTVISFLVVFFFSILKETHLNALMAGWALGVCHLVFSLVLFMFSKKLKQKTAFHVNFLGLVIRFMLSILILIIVAVVMRDSFAIAKHFYFSFLLVYFFYLPFEVYAFKKLST